MKIADFMHNSVDRIHWGIPPLYTFVFGDRDEFVDEGLRLYDVVGSLVVVGVLQLYKSYTYIICIYVIYIYSTCILYM